MSSPAFFSKVSKYLSLILTDSSIMSPVQTAKGISIPLYDIIAELAMALANLDVDEMLSSLFFSTLSSFSEQIAHG